MSATLEGAVLELQFEGIFRQYFPTHFVVALDDVLDRLRLDAEIQGPLSVIIVAASVVGIVAGVVRTTAAIAEAWAALNTGSAIGLTVGGSGAASITGARIVIPSVAVNAEGLVVVVGASAAGAVAAPSAAAAAERLRMMSEGSGGSGSSGGGKRSPPPTQFGPKIEKQLAKRGWTKELVEETVEKPARTVRTRDTRHLPDGGRMDDPATAYYSERGGYVVRNDRTGDIVQVSNRNDAGWRAPWD